MGAEPATPLLSRYLGSFFLQTSTGHNFCIRTPIFWRLFEWKSAHLGLFSDGPLGLYENPCPFPHIYLLLAIIRTWILFS
jgi:hypothetical protein